MTVAHVGLEWVVDASGCDARRLRSREAMEALFAAVIRAAGVNVVGVPLVHVFPGEGGVTALALLSESHLSLHTYPEHRVLTLNLHTCGARREVPFQALLAEHAGAEGVQVRALERGAHPA